jgi:isovaleryl-CoA dehydrogenase
LGITAQEKYGGSEMDALAAVIAHEELSSSDPAFCLSFLAHSMLFVNNVARNASDEQCKKYLPGACSGEKICGMGMSEPSVGTDVLGMRTTAKKSDCGKYYILNGTKYVCSANREDKLLNDER